MKSVIPITILLPILLQAITTHTPLKNPLLYEEQRKIYDAKIKERKSAVTVYTELKSLPLSKESTESQACIQIESIETQSITLIDKKDLEALIKPYLHRCDTMEDINTLVKKINNIYIKKAYVTSRAYIKPQDLSKGHLIIVAMEGKVEKISESNISTGLIFPTMEGAVLDLRDLEIGIEQLNRKAYIVVINLIQQKQKLNM